MKLRTVRRPRRYVAQHWLTLLAPVFSYDRHRNAYVLRGVGERFGPALRPERRTRGGVERRVWREQRLEEALEHGERLDRRRRRPRSMA